MDTWARQSGFPVLTIKRENDDLLISQKSMLLEKYESKMKKKKLTADDEEKEEAPKEYVEYFCIFENIYENIFFVNSYVDIRTGREYPNYFTGGYFGLLSIRSIN